MSRVNKYSMKETKAGRSELKKKLIEERRKRKVIQRAHSGHKNPFSKERGQYHTLSKQKRI